MKLVQYDDLPEDKKMQQPNNGCGREDARYLVFEIDGKTVYRSDAMEPEDSRFTRDLSWIQSDLEKLVTERDILRVALTDALDWLENAPISYANGNVHNGMDEGDVLGSRYHEKLVAQLRAALSTKGQTHAS